MNPSFALVRQPRIEWVGETPYLGLQATSWNWLLKKSPCSYCGTSANEAEMTIDHIRSKGRWLKRGRSRVARKARRAWIALYNDYGDMNNNTTTACQSCNQAKATKELLHFLLERTA